MRRVAAALIVLGVASCAWLQAHQSDIDRLCATAVPLASAAMPIPIVGPFIAAGIPIACQTEQGLARLKADPSSAEWLAQQIAMLRQALGR